MSTFAPVFEPPVLDAVAADPVVAHGSVLQQLAGLPATVAEYRSCSDEVLTTILELVADEERLIAGIKAVVVGVIAERSRPELGIKGLARKAGFVNTEELLRTTTGASQTEAKRIVDVARVVVEAAGLQADPRTGEVREPVAPWLHEAARLLAAGVLSVEQFRALRDGIGKPFGNVNADILGSAVAELLPDAPTTAADTLRSLAQLKRDAIDEAGIRDREAAQYQQRSFRITRLPDGMSRATWLLAPEDAMIVHQLFDRATSPKLGGPRFVDPDKVAQADAIENDPRTPFQLASDVMLDLLRLGAEADPSALLGSEAPAVQLVIMKPVLDARVGHGVILGTDLTVSLDTVERLACAHGTQVATFEHLPGTPLTSARPLDHGRSRRLFTKKQRQMMAIRDGGCRWCGRPPSWTEAHHINHWLRDHGDSNIDDGILLCRRCHLRVHNERWEITHPPDDPSTFQLIPPASVDPTQTPRPLPSRSRPLTEG